MNLENPKTQHFDFRDENFIVEFNVAAPEELVYLGKAMDKEGAFYGLFACFEDKSPNFHVFDEDQLKDPKDIRKSPAEADRKTALEDLNSPWKLAEFIFTGPNAYGPMFFLKNPRDKTRGYKIGEKFSPTSHEITLANPKKARFYEPIPITRSLLRGIPRVGFFRKWVIA